MEKKIIAGVILIIIALAIVVSTLLSYRPGGVSAPSGSTPTSTLQGATNNPGGSSNPDGGFPSIGNCAGVGTFSCRNSNITTSGLLSLSLVSGTSSPLYNIHMACIALNSSSKLPANASSWYSLSNLGTPKPSNFTGTSLHPLEIENVASLQCYDGSGSPVSLAPGQIYKGVVLIKYTSTSAPINSSTKWATIAVAGVNLNAKQVV